MTDFEVYREAARAAIEDADCHPVMIEDFPSMDASSRSACLDLVDSSDAYVAMIGDRPGSSPLGKPVVEQEFEEARRKKLPRLLFLQDTTRDEETEQLVGRLSDFVHGRFRKTFRTPDELRTEMVESLKGLYGENYMPVKMNDPSVVEKLLLPDQGDGYSAMLRITVIPERVDEVFDVLTLEDPAFHRNLYKIGHSDAVRLFDFEHGKKPAAMDEGDLVLVQEPNRGRTPSIGVKLRIAENGAVTIDQTLANRHGQSGFGFDNRQITVAEVSEALRSSFAFVGVLYDSVDAGLRYSTFFHGAATSGMSMHSIVKELREQRSWAISDDKGWVVLDKPRRADRTDLTSPLEIVQRIGTFIQKRYGQSGSV